MSGHFVIQPDQNVLFLVGRFDFLKLLSNPKTASSLKNDIQSGRGIPLELVGVTSTSDEWSLPITNFRTSFRMTNEQLTSAINSVGYLAGAILHILEMDKKGGIHH